MCLHDYVLGLKFCSARLAALWSGCLRVDWQVAVRERAFGIVITPGEPRETVFPAVPVCVQAMQSDADSSDQCQGSAGEGG